VLHELSTAPTELSAQLLVVGQAQHGLGETPRFVGWHAQGMLPALALQVHRVLCGQRRRHDGRPTAMMLKTLDAPRTNGPRVSAARGECRPAANAVAKPSLGCSSAADIAKAEPAGFSALSSVIWLPLRAG